MTLGAHLRSWSGSALRHIPAGAHLGVLDVRYAGRAADNRWNEPGHPTLYLAGDEGVLIAEWGRHFAINRTPQLQSMTVERIPYALEVSIGFLLDLRDTGVCDSLSLTDAPICFANIAVARATAQFVRGTTEAQALLAPSMEFLDDLDRWCLDVFLEKLPSDPRSFISSVTRCGQLRWG